MRIGCPAYATSQGLGHLAKSFFDAGVITDVFIIEHPQNSTHFGWYPAGTPHTRLRQPDEAKLFAWLKGLDVLLCFETPLVWSLIGECKKLGIKTVLVPMHEWQPEKPPFEFDQWLCPSLLDLQYFKDKPGAEFIQIPVDPIIKWQQRTVAKRFLHNAGHIGCRGHKGTLELLRAMRFVKSPLWLDVRCQDHAGMQRLLAQVPAIRDDRRVSIVTGDLARQSLFSEEFDVYVAPERFNGISLPLQEAFASGMLVMTTNRFPMNTWLPVEPLIPVTAYHPAKTQSSNLAFEEATVDPRNIAAKMDQWYNQDISSFSLQGKVWAEVNSWEALKPKWMEVLRR